MHVENGVVFFGQPIEDHHQRVKVGWDFENEK